MSDTTTPAGDAGGDTTTSIAATLAALPARIRIHALAKLLGRSSRDVLTAVTDLGGDGRSVQSSIDRDTALRVAESFGLVEPAQPESAPAEPAPAEPQAAPVPEPVPEPVRRVPPTPVFASASPLFLPPEPPVAPPPVRKPEPVVEVDEDDTPDDGQDDDDSDDSRPRRRRGRRGRGRGKGGQDDIAEDALEEEPAKPSAQEKSDKQDKPERPEKADGKRRSKAKAEEPEAESAEDDQPEGEESDAASRRRRRRRRRKGGVDDEGGPTEDDPPNTVVHVREARDDKDKGGDSDGRDEVRSVRGSTRLEAKRQRRRDGREAGRRRAPILSEAEFLARRESVDRAMVVRERGDRIQIGVLEDGVLVEHFVTSSGSGSLVGNVYLGRVQNVLPSMEAAFVDIGRGRNAVLYAGEVDWDAAGLEGKARKIEQALSTGDSVLVQVTKDPVGHKGARLTTQISLPGRFLVYVPGGGATGISRKLPENERRRLKDVLKRVVPEDAGVIIRTASEGISEEELARDVRRLQAQWQVIQDKTKGGSGVRKVNAPALVYEEPDLLVKVVRDLFTEDFSALVIEGAGAWETVEAYVRHVAPELTDRVRKHVGLNDVFAEYRIEEQLLKALDRKVWLPSGGYLVIDRTEAMTVIDVNTGKFTGSGGNLEETVTRNNLESAEEIVRQLRLRDIGGIIVIDFIDMVLESNRDLVLRRLTECLGRDRTRHQVAEVTSLGLVQMTRKRVGTGLLEAFGTTCEHCKGRGVLISIDPVGKSSGGGGGGNGHSGGQGGGHSGGQHAGGSRRNRNRGDDGSKDSAAKDSAAKDAAAKEAAAKEAAKAVRDIAAATTKPNGGEAQSDPGQVGDAEPAAAAATDTKASTGGRRGRNASGSSHRGAKAEKESPAEVPTEVPTESPAASVGSQSTPDAPASSALEPDSAEPVTTGFGESGASASTVSESGPVTTDQATSAPIGSASPGSTSAASGPVVSGSAASESAESGSAPSGSAGSAPAASGSAASGRAASAPAESGSAASAPTASGRDTSDLVTADLAVAGRATSTSAMSTSTRSTSAASTPASSDSSVAESTASRFAASTSGQTVSAISSPAGSGLDPTATPGVSTPATAASDSVSVPGTAGSPDDQEADTSGHDTSGHGDSSQGDSGQGEDASAEQLPNRTRRRSRRSTAPPSVTAEQANVTPAATQTAPAGEPGASTVIVPSSTPGDSTEPANGGAQASAGQAERNGEHEQANGHTHDAEAAAETDHSASDVPSVTPPARRPVRRGASRPAGPPVNATHDG